MYFVIQNHPDGYPANTSFRIHPYECPAACPAEYPDSLWQRRVADIETVLYHPLPTTVVFLEFVLGNARDSRESQL